MIIDKKSFEILEFEKILKTCMECCYGQESALLLQNQPFLSTFDEWQERLSKVKQFYRIYDTVQAPSFFFPSIEPIFSLLKPVDALADSFLLYQAARFFQFFMEWKNFLEKIVEENFPNEKEEFPFLEEFPQSVPFLYEEVLKTFDSEGFMIADHEDMKQLRREKQQVNEAIHDFSSSLLSEQKEIWQEDQLVFRNGRLLFPLKSNYKGRVKGFIHEVSASSNTLFIEPFEMLDLNNKLVELETREKQIQLKWMRIFSSNFHDHIEVLYHCYQVALTMDSFSARALYAKKYRCHFAKWGEKIELPQAVHPLLGEKAVPVEIDFDKTVDIAVISGSNAGGKTVLLKTIALAAMMNQFGMSVHAGEGAMLPLFTHLICVIGDNQSIDEGVSTFSAYMKQVAHIFEVADSKSLIFLDELGSGTDPMEGSSLGVAILEKLEKIGCKTFVTTHHQDIRNYAHNSSKAVNVAVLFDEVSQQPSYQIKMGFFGESRAIEIASRSGLPPSLINTARRLLKEGKGDALHLMEKLAQKEIHLKRQSEELSLKDQKLQEQYRLQELKSLSLKQKELNLKRDKQAEISLFVKAIKKQLESLTDDLNRLKKEVSKMIELPQPLDANHKEEDQALKKRTLEKLQAANQQITDFWDHIKKEGQKKSRYLDELKSEVIHARAFTFKVGMKVLVAPHDREGEIIRAGKKGNWIVQIGNIKMSLDESQLTPCDSSKSASKKEKSHSNLIEFSVDFTHQKAQWVLDLRGFTLEEAKKALQEQIERALLNQLKQFSIIHGLGEGVLQKGMHEELKKYRCVKEFGFASPECGGFGRTEVLLDL